MIDLWALTLLLVGSFLFIVLTRRYRQQEPILYYTLFPAQTSWKSRFPRLPRYLFLAALFFFLGAFLDPHGTKALSPTEKETTQEGLAIYFILDMSRSMEEKIITRDEAGSRRTVSKFNMLKEMTREFILEHPHDLIGALAFSRGAVILSPLTLDHQAVISALASLKIPQDLNQQGTAIGYAVFKTANLITATRQNLSSQYTLRDAIMILVTDGFQDPNPLDRGRRFRTMEVEEAGEYARQQKLRLYIVNVEPKLNTEQFLPNRRQMQRIAESTGGKFFPLEEGKTLKDIYKAIDGLEKSKLPVPAEQQWTLVRTWSLYPYLIGLGLLCLFLGAFLQSTILKTFP